MAKIVFEGVYKEYDKVVAVKDFNLEVDDYETIVIVGPSGCGKSTVLRMLAGLEEITKGNVFIDGINSNSVAPRNRNIAMVFQNYSLFPNMNVYNNIAFGLAAKKCDDATIDRRVNEVAEMLGLKPFLKRKPHKLSGGEKQRVAIGRALAVEKEILLLDEPLASIDAELKIEMRTKLMDLIQRLKTTCICVSHDQIDAMTLANRIVVMNKGEIQQIGTPMEVYNYPNNQFVGNFFGTMNFVNSLNIDKPNPDYIIGFRPEDVIIPGDNEGKISKVIDLGSELMLYVNNNQNEIIIKCNTPHHENERITFNVKKYHFFNQEGQRITT